MKADDIIRIAYRMLTRPPVTLGDRPAPKPHDVAQQRRAGRPPRPTWLPPKNWTRDYIASDDFLETWQWRKVRYRRLELSDGRCQACGRSRRDGVTLNVDHIWPRRYYPNLCLTIEATQVLCGPCNHGRGNESTRDWR